MTNKTSKKQKTNGDVSKGFKGSKIKFSSIEHERVINKDLSVLKMSVKKSDQILIVWVMEKYQ